MSNPKIKDTNQDGIVALITNSQKVREFQEVIHNHRESAFYKYMHSIIPQELITKHIDAKGNFPVVMPVISKFGFNKIKWFFIQIEPRVIAGSIHARKHREKLRDNEGGYLVKRWHEEEGMKDSAIQEEVAMVVEKIKEHILNYDHTAIIVNGYCAPSWIIQPIADFL